MSKENVVLLDTSGVRICGEDIGRLDIFIYEDSQPGELEQHITAKPPYDSLKIVCRRGEKKAVIITDSPYEYEDEKLKFYDSIELIRHFYGDECVGRKTGTSIYPFSSGEPIVVETTPLGSEIVLEEVSHRFPDYLRMEDPIVRLADAVSWCEAFREEGFRTADFQSDTSGMRGLVWDRLPCDVGLYPQNPGTRLYCYPNNDDFTKTKIIVECIVNGRRKSFTGDLPSIRRNRRYNVKLIVEESPEDYGFQISEEI